MNENFAELILQYQLRKSSVCTSAVTLKIVKIVKFWTAK